MLFRFKSQACADLVMLEADARRLLQVMIGADPDMGIVQAVDLPAALVRLQEAVQQEALKRGLSTGQELPPDASSDTVADEEDQPAIGLAQRAVPMMTMLQRCIEGKADLVWGV